MAMHVRSPADALDVLRRYLIDGSRPETVIICLDDSAEVVAVVMLEGERAPDWIAGMENEVLRLIPDGTTAVVFASSGPRGTDDHEVRYAWHRLSEVVADEGVSSLDWLSITDSECRSLATGDLLSPHLVDSAFGGPENLRERS